MALSAEQIKNNLIDQILQNFPTAEVDTGSVLRDVFVDPQSIQIAALSEELDYISYLSTFVQNSDYISESDMDEIGSTYGVARNSGNVAVGSVTFRAVTRPAQNIQIGADDGSGGVSVKTLMSEGGNSYEFVTTQTVYLTTDAYYNEKTGFYEVTAPIKATSSGSVFNLGIGTIKVLSNGIANITGCYNYVPTNGGTDIQTNIEYAQSIQDAILGSSKNIESGVNALLRKVEGVQEVKTLHPNSVEEPTDVGYAISYIRGSNEQIDSHTFTYVTTTQEYSLPKKPVVRIISVSATVNGQQKQLENGIDYYLYPTLEDVENYNYPSDTSIDSKTKYFGTIYSTDKIIFLKTASGTPDPNTDVTVNFSYNKLIKDCQETLNTNLQDYLILGTLLAAQATPISIDLRTTIKLKYNYNNEAVKDEILTGLSNYIQSMTLGQDLTQEQIYSYLNTTFSEYINAVVYPFLRFNKRNQTDTVNEIKFTYGQYANIDENSLKIDFE